jgi:hypothetical protein
MQEQLIGFLMDKAFEERYEFYSLYEDENKFILLYLLF